MSQRNVERVIGLLVTDEGFRRRFTVDPVAALAELGRCGVELTDGEIRAVASIDPARAAAFADALDPRLQKTDLRSGA